MHSHEQEQSHSKLVFYDLPWKQCFQNFPQWHWWSCDQRHSDHWWLSESWSVVDYMSQSHTHQLHSDTFSNQGHFQNNNQTAALAGDHCWDQTLQMMTVVRMNHLFNEKLHWWWWWRCDRSQWVTSVCQCLPSTVGMQWVVIWYSRVSGERVKHAESSRSEVTRDLV